MILGNDISSFQGNVNFDTYKNNSNFLLLKVSEGVGFTDKQFVRNQSEGRRVFLPLGYYHFARPDLNSDATKEVDYFLSVIGELRNGEVLILDYEPKWSGDAVLWCKTWLDNCFKKTGVKPFIYLNQSQVTSFNWKPIVDAGYALYIAAYTGDPNKNTFKTGAWPLAAMQQWSNAQQVPGIPSAADADVFFGSIEQFKAYGYKVASPLPPSSNTVEVLASKFEELVSKSTAFDTIADKLNKPRNSDVVLSEIDQLTKIEQLSIEKDKQIGEANARANDLANKLSDLTNQYQALQNNYKASQDTLESLKLDLKDAHDQLSQLKDVINTKPGAISILIQFLFKILGRK